MFRHMLETGGAGAIVPPSRMTGHSQLSPPSFVYISPLSRSLLETLTAQTHSASERPASLELFFKFSHMSVMALKIDYELLEGENPVFLLSTHNT